MTKATGTTERDAAKVMLRRTVRKAGATLGVDKGYDVPEFVEAVRDDGVTPHVAQKAKGSAIDGRTTCPAGYRNSLTIRKRIEEVFGWAKTVGGLRKTKLRGLKKVPDGRIVWLALVDRLGGGASEIRQAAGNTLETGDITG